MKSKRILFIHTIDTYTGSAKVGADIVNNFSSKQDLFFIESNDGGFLENTVYNKNIFTKSSKYYLINLILFQVKGFFYLLRNQKKYDLIIINTLGPFLPLFATMFSSEKKVIQYIHEQKIVNPILNFLCVSITKIVRPNVWYPSFFLQNYHSKNFGKGTVLYPAVSDSFNNSHKTILNITNIVLMVSSLKIYKGVTKFINVSSLFFLIDPNVEFRLVLSCTSSEFEDYLLQNKLKRNRNLKVYFKPKNIVDIYLSSKIVVNLTQRGTIIESYGLSLAEAIICEKPIICPDIGGPFEINENEKFGLFVDENSVDDIILKIKLLLYDDNLYESKRSWCINNKDRFSINLFRATFNELLTIKK